MPSTQRTCKDPVPGSVADGPRRGDSVGYVGRARSEMSALTGAVIMGQAAMGSVDLGDQAKRLGVGRDGVLARAGE